MAVQECAMHVDWSPLVLREWPEECGDKGQLLFRGPRWGPILYVSLPFTVNGNVVLHSLDGYVGLPSLNH